MRSTLRVRSLPAAAVLIASLVLLSARTAAPQSAEPAALILTNAVVHTVDPNRPLAEAVAIAGDRILFVGSERGALLHRGARTQVIDLEGHTVVPGFIDAHAHLAGLGDQLQVLDLVGTTSYEEIVELVRARVQGAPEGRWIRGRGWDQNDWSDTRFPTNEALSAVSPNNPVYLRRVDGHAALVNARVLEMAGIARDTPDPEGGRIVRDADTGEPTGVLVDRAMGLFADLIPELTRDEQSESILLAIAECLRWGVTSIHDAGVSPQTSIGPGMLEVYRELAERGQFRIRNYVMIRSDEETLERFFESGPEVGLYNNHLTVRAIKISADGALGSRGAALLEPYRDDPGNIGLVTTPPDHICRVAVEALKNGWQLNVHAIGDRGNRLVLDAFESALEEVPVADHRFRIEHAQVLHWTDIPRFAELDVLPSMQQTHQMSDMYWAVDRIGWTRAQGAYAWRSLLNSGVVIPSGTDFPVEPVNPFRTFLAAIARQDENGWPSGGWFPNQLMTREEALKSMTIWAAYGAFEEDIKGSITAGKLADLVVLSQDIMSIPPRRILDTTIEMTIVGGEIVYTPQNDGVHTSN